MDDRFSLALAAHQRGDLNNAAELYNEIIRTESDHHQAIFYLGILHCQRQQQETGIELIKSAISLFPGSAHYHLGLAKVFIDCGDWRQAVSCCDRALSQENNLAEAYFAKGVALNLLGLRQEAQKAYRDAIRNNPLHPGALNNLGLLCQENGGLAEADDLFRRAIEAGRNFAEAHNNLGNLLKKTGNNSEALEQFRIALAIRPDYAEAWSNMAGAYSAQGRQDEAYRCDQQAITLNPGHFQAHSNLLLSLHYQPDFTPEQIFAKHKEWATTHTADLPAPAPHTNDRSRDRKLRLGYLSPDFRSHSVAFFIREILANHDHSRFEVFCYADVAREDEMTAGLKKFASTWQDVHGLPDERIAALVREDGIDILIDLAGHTAPRLMKVLARKPSPVQITYLGYPNTTGLSSVDYRLTDCIADPLSVTDHLHTETLIRLPKGFLCYTAPENSPPLSEPPVTRKGFITFGSFNAVAKINAAVVSTWAAIMKRVPASRLLLKSVSLHDQASRALISEAFARQGIEPGRLDLLATLPSRFDHLALYNEIDIALDTFPYNGTTTTCEALWMGVPTVVLKGRSHVGLVGASILSQVGLHDFIASTPEEYISLACKACARLDRLRELRAGMKNLLRSSPLMDGPGFTDKLESVYRQVWKARCDRQ